MKEELLKIEEIKKLCESALRGGARPEYIISQIIKVANS